MIRPLSGIAGPSRYAAIAVLIAGASLTLGACTAPPGYEDDTPATIDAPAPPTDAAGSVDTTGLFDPDVPPVGPDAGPQPIEPGPPHSVTVVPAWVVGESSGGGFTISSLAAGAVPAVPLSGPGFYATAGFPAPPTPTTPTNP